MRASLAHLTSGDRKALTLAAVIAAAALLLALIDPRAALTGWMGACVPLAAVPAGAFCLMAMMKLIPGAWGEELRLTCEAGSLLALPALAAFVPVMIGSVLIYPWARGPAESPFQGFWLGPIPFAIRTILWFLLLWRASRQLRARRNARHVASGALVAFPLLGSLVAVDWLMSLDPKFASSAFGLQTLILSIGLAFAVLLRFRLAAGSAPYRPGVLGGLLLTLLLMWAYIQFLTFFISWSPGLPDSAAWYLRRTGAWGGAAWAFGLLGGVPLLMLLLTCFRSDPVWLGRLCLAVIAGKLIEFAWFALPGTGPVGVFAYVLTLAALSLLAATGLRSALRSRIAARMPS